MSRCELRPGVLPWLWRLALLLPLASTVSGTEKEGGKNIQTVQQRLTLASHMIQRMQGEKKVQLNAELEALQTRFLVNVDSTLVDDSNTFFQRVMTTYRAASQSGEAADEDVHKRRYEQKRKELDAFRQSYAALVAERGDAARQALDEHKFLARVESSEKLARARQYEDAYSAADGAYHQLIGALKALRDNETIEYRLEFGSPKDEYEYENRRFESQKMLLDMIVAEKQPSANSMAQIEALVARADSEMNVARGLAHLGHYEQAVDKQELAVAELAKAMRVAGVYF